MTIFNAADYTTKELVAIWNSVADRAIKKFVNRKAAEDRITALISGASSETIEEIISSCSEKSAADKLDKTVGKTSEAPKPTPSLFDEKKPEEAEEEKEDKVNKDLMEEYGRTTCDRCTVHLSNGIGTFKELFESEISKGSGAEEAFNTVKEDMCDHESYCMNCDQEFGPEVKKEDYVEEKKEPKRKNPEFQTDSEREAYVRTQYQTKTEKFPGRKSQFAGKELSVKNNIASPFRQGTVVENSFLIIQNAGSISYEQFRIIGGRNTDLKAMVDKGIVIAK